MPQARKTRRSHGVLQGLDREPSQASQVTLLKQHSLAKQNARTSYMPSVGCKTRTAESFQTSTATPLRSEPR